MAQEHDESSWPIVVDRAIGEQTDADVEAYLTVTENLLLRGQSFVAIFDSTHGRLVNPWHKRRVATWIDDHAASLKTLRLGFVFVSPSLLDRAMLHGTYWIRKPPYPYAIVPSVKAAQKWARGVLSRQPSSPTGTSK